MLYTIVLQNRRAFKWVSRVPLFRKSAYSEQNWEYHVNKKKRTFVTYKDEENAWNQIGIKAGYLQYMLAPFIQFCRLIFITAKHKNNFSSDFYWTCSPRANQRCIKLTLADVPAHNLRLNKSIYVVLFKKSAYSEFLLNRTVFHPNWFGIAGLYVLPIPGAI